MLTFDFSIFEKKDGEVIFKKTVEFYGGATNPNFMGGVYVTSDPYEIKLLKAHPDFGQVFVMEYCVGEEKLVEVKPEVSKTNKEPEKISEEKVVAEEKPEPTEVIEVSTLAEGIMYLKKSQPSLKVTSLRTKDALKSKALEMGFTFPNL